MLPSSAPALAIQMIVVAIVTIQRDSQHNEIDNSEPINHRYDYIIIGAGSAGCAVARRLAEDYSVNVLLLEAGGPQSSVSDTPGIENTWTVDNPQWNWNFQIFPQRRTGLGLAVPGVYPEMKGKVIGGTSTINRMVYSRGHPRDYDNWVEKYGAKGWSFAEVLPYFIRSENNSDFNIIAQNREFHGVGGPLDVSSDPQPNILLRKVQRSYNDFGLPVVDLNSDRQVGSAIIQLTTKNGMRESAANAYIDPNPYPKNLFISIKSYVTRILFTKVNGKLIASGVEFVKKGQKFIVEANKEVILTAGAYNSAKILMLSGIGPKEHLDEMGITTKVDLPVGNNLQEHPAVFIFTPFTPKAPFEPFPAMTIQQLHQMITTGTGPLASSSGLYTHINTKSNPTPDWPNIMIAVRREQFSTNLTETVSFYSANRRKEWEQYFGPYVGQPYLINSVFLRKIKSKGWVRLASADPFVNPLINPNFLEFEREWEDTVEAIKFQLYFLLNSQISKYVQLIPKPIPGCQFCPDRPIYDCDSYIRCYIREIGDKEHHNCGTNRMGDPDRPDTVVDPRLRVKYVSQLRVCDSSIIPQIPVGNTNAPTIMIGEKCADLIKQDHSYRY